MPSWSYADLLEAVAETIPEAPYQIQGERVACFGDFDRRTNALGVHPLDALLSQQSEVAAYLMSSPEYMETYLAAFKTGLAPMNTNFRYGPEELLYLFDDADAEAVVFHTSLASRIEPIRGRLPRVRCWLAVDDAAFVPDWASSYEKVVAEDGSRPAPPWGRSSDELMLLYLLMGGSTVLLEERHFDPVELWRTVERRRVYAASLVTEIDEQGVQR